MADTSQSASQAQAASHLKIRVRYARLSLAVVGLLAIIATVIGAIVAPFTALTFGWVGVFFLVGLGSVATLRMLAVRDRNRKLLANLEATRQRAMNTPAFADEANREAARPRGEDKVFDARPGSNRRAPAITAEELRAEALRVAHGFGGVKEPATWEPTQVPRPTYVEVREATQREIAARVSPEPIPVSEPLRPSRPISLKASEESKRIAAEVSAEDRAAVAKVADKLAASAAETGTESASSPDQGTVPAAVAKPADTSSVAEPAATVAERQDVAPKTRLNLDAVMQRRRA